MKILISDTNCKFINNIKITLQNQNKHNIYETNKKNIFKLYDTIEPDLIFLSSADKDNNDINNFLDLYDKKTKIIIEETKYNKLLNDKIYYNLKNTNRIYVV
jgi:hypothetical protein